MRSKKNNDVLQLMIFLFATAICYFCQAKKYFNIKVPLIYPVQPKNANVAFILKNFFVKKQHRLI